MLRIVSISDTHAQHRKLSLPDADMIVSAGDWSYKGEPEVVEDFIAWMKELPYQFKVVIMGNHELSYDKEPTRPKKIKALELMKEAGIHYLENSEVVINEYKIWGSPIQPWFHNWAWNYQRGPEIAEVWSKIPDDTNILITHGPPYGKLDRVEKWPTGAATNEGCKDLKARIQELSQLKAHIFGHLHLQGGQMLDVDGVKYVNAAVCDEKYQPINKIMVIDV